MPRTRNKMKIPHRAPPGKPCGSVESGFLLPADVSTAQAEKVIAMIFPFQEPFDTPGEDGKEAFRNVEKSVL